MAARLPPMENVAISPSPPLPPTLSLRIVTLDYYTTTPSPPLDLCWSELQGEPIETIPVIRVFGCTPGGQKACLHLHRALPYFYVPYDEDLPQDVPSAIAFARKAAIALDVALNMTPGHLNAPVSRRQRVFDAVLVRGTPFYGYHPEERVWIKFLMYDPKDVSRAASLLLAGAILGRSFQPHESHVPYLLQFKMDFNLHGMGWVELDAKAVRFRSLPKDHVGERDGSSQMKSRSFNSKNCKDGLNSGRWTTSTVLSNVAQQGGEGEGEDWHEAMTTCELEFDAGVDAIRNRGGLKRLPLAAVNSKVQLVESLAPMWAGVGLSIPSPPPPVNIQRSPVPLVSEDDLLWQEFKSKVDIYPVCNPLEASQKDQRMSLSSHSLSPLLARTQRANETILPSPPSGSKNVALHKSQSQNQDGSQTIDHSQFVDREVVMTQGEVCHQEAWGDQVLQRRDHDTFSNEDSDGDENEDLLLAMAMQLTPLPRSQQTQQTPPLTSTTGHQTANQDGAVQENRVVSSQDQAHHRAQQVLDTYIAKSQKECDDIIDCSGFEPDGDGGDDEPTIHQVDGTWDEDGDKSMDEVEQQIRMNEGEATSDVIEDERKQLSIDKGLMTTHQAPRVPRVPGLRRVVKPDRYMDRDQVKAASNSLTATLYLLGKRKEHDEAKLEEEEEEEEDNNKDGNIDDGGNSSIPGTERMSSGASQDQQSPHAVTNIEDSETPCDGWDQSWGNGADEVNTMPGGLLDDYADYEDKELWGGSDGGGSDHQHRLACPTVLITPAAAPPSRQSILSSMWDHDLLPVLHPTPFYGVPTHAPKRAVVFAGKEMHIPTNSPESLNPFTFGKLSENRHSKLEVNGPKHPIGVLPYSPAPFPPPRKAAIAWAEARNLGSGDKVAQSGQSPLHGTQETGEEMEEFTLKPASPKYDETFVKDSAVKRTPSQITMPTVAKRVADTPSSQLGYRRGGCLGKGQQQQQRGEGVSLLCLEMVAECRGRLLPDPRLDAIQCVVMILSTDDQDDDGLDDGKGVPISDFKNNQGNDADSRKSASSQTKVALLHQPPSSRAHLSAGPAKDSLLPGFSISCYDSEEALLDAVCTTVVGWDPDILCGFDVRKGSWGYLADRAACALERPDFLIEISRLRARTLRNQDGASRLTLKVPDEQIHVPGRIVLDVWTLMRQELKLRVYTLQSCCAAVLRRRIPNIPPHQLYSWLQRSQDAWQTLSHVSLCTFISLSLLFHLDLVSRTAELARTFGIDFFSVLSRGSQYRVESMMLRLARSQNYIALSPSPEQVARQPAMECLPLVMEPKSGMYHDPVCVLDFQSLYPSMIIAYNLCFSTCVGRPAHISNSTNSQNSKLCEDQAGNQLGCAPNFRVLVGERTFPKGFVDSIHLAPNGVGFVKPEVRPGILPRLLAEILETRVMIKGAMSKTTQKPMLKTLNARQLGLKLIANVTYGYAAAGFSGRMPMAELADAIVQSGRDTLERAIRLVEGRKEWRAKVVYGDTDSLFVCLPGRTVEEALKLGKEMAEAVTASNPPPVLLKLEKVYRPCVLMSKKRYVGAMFEKLGQKTPQFDAKGIETVRRDSCPAVAKSLESVLQLLFSNPDLSIVKMYLERQWTKILRGTVSIADFVFSKEVRVGGYAGTLPPAALVAARATAADPRAEPRTGQRVSYVVVSGAPGARLVDMVIPPHELVQHPDQYKLCGVYYITKQIIPALDRVLSLIGVDVSSWFASLPRPKRIRHNRINTNRTIDAFYLSRHCAACERLREFDRSDGTALCNRCLSNPQLAAALVYGRVNRIERQYVEMVRVCIGCGGGRGALIACNSLDCPVYFERCSLRHELDFNLRELPSN